MYLTRKLKICASVLLAIAFVGMPWAIMIASTYVPSGDIVMQPPDFGPIEPLAFDEPPVCIMNYETIIHMTTETTFNLEDSINLDTYFYDADTRDLTYTVEYMETFAIVELRDNYLATVTTFSEYDESLIKVWASDGVNQVSYDFVLRVEVRETFPLNEDIPKTFDVTKYVPPTLEIYEMETTSEISATINYENYIYANLDIVSSENWWGSDCITLSLVDEPRYIFPIPPFDQEVMSIDEPLYVYGFFEFDIEVSAVNDPPLATSDETYLISITEDTSAGLVNPIQLNNLFTDVDSELQYSWNSEFGLSSINIYESSIVSIASGTMSGSDSLKIVANDGEYVTTFDIPVLVQPRSTIAMIEDVGYTLDLNYLFEETTQDCTLIGSENIAATIGEDSEGAPQAYVDSDMNWFGNDVVSLSVYPNIVSINPPRILPTPMSLPPGPSIPPQPTADIMYNFYDFDVGVAAVNDPPYAMTAPTITISEDEMLNDAFNIRDFFGDVDSVLEYALDDSSANFVAVDAGLDGSVDISALSNWFGTETFTITATDGEYEASEDVSVQVMPVNDVPFATGADASLAFAEDANITVHLDEIISDIDSALWFSYNCSDTNSTLELNETTWEMNVIPDENWNGIIDIVVYGSDGDFELARNLTLNVAAVNDPPEIISTRNIIMTEDVDLDLDISTFITDVDSELEYTIFACRGKLQCDRVQGTIWALSTSQGHWNGNDILRIIAYDGQYMLNLNLNVEVMAVNYAPVQTALTPQASISEDSTFSLAVDKLFTDVDEDILAYTFDSGDIFQLEYNEESMMLAITPDENWSGDSTVSIQANDGLLWTTIEVPVNVASVNDAPYQVSGIPAIALVAENTTTISLSSYFSDVDSYALTIEAVGTDTIEVTPMDARGVFRIQSLESWEGIQTLIIKVSDGVDVTETQLTVSTYIPEVTMKTTAAQIGFVDTMTWILLGMAVAFALVITYTATENRKPNTRTAPKKEKIL